MYEEEEHIMRKLIPGLVIGGALLLGACGSPTTVNDAANQAATAVTDPTNQAAANDALNQAATAVSEPTTAAAINDAANQAATALADPTNQAALNDAANQAATAVTDPTNQAAAAGALSAVADDVTLQQGQALVLDASKSAGNIKDYKWTITKAPTGAESVVGQVIKENSNGNVTIDPADYAKYFPKSGDYTVQLTVTDTAGQTANNNFDITVP
jgi:uncharacterized protein YcfL